MSGNADHRSRRPALRTGITSQPLEAGRLLAEVGDHSDGGVILFLGRVRRENRGRPVRRLLYEAYLEMAEEELARIASETADSFDVGAITVVHRVGTLEPGEASLAVAVAAPHRDAAFRAARAVIEAVKTRLPVWKREEYEDGTARWLGESETAAGSHAGPAAEAAGSSSVPEPGRSS